MRYTLVTAGEQLAYFIEQRIIHSQSWHRVDDFLYFTGRSAEMRSFIHELAVINLTCKIVAAGNSLLKESAERPARSVFDPGFEADLHEFIRERLYIRPPLSKELLRQAIRAVTSAQYGLSQNVRRTIKRQAERDHPFCYMCGVSIDFTEEHEHYRFSVDHIWPQRFGGDSVEDNLLPACGSCNNGKKHEFASWAMPAIQSVMLGFHPSANEYTTVDGSHRFALHHLAAKKIAIQRQISLKQALLLLGPWEKVPRLIDEDDIGDFFNLAIHRTDFEIS